MHFQAASETGRAFAPVELSLLPGFVGGVTVISDVPFGIFLIGPAQNVKHNTSRKDLALDIQMNFFIEPNPARQ
jgi:hypothetical protein